MHAQKAHKKSSPAHHLTKPRKTLKKKPNLLAQRSLHTISPSIRHSISSSSSARSLTQFKTRHANFSTIKHAPNISVSQFQSDYLEERQQLEQQKLATQLGKDHYDFNSMTSMSPEYRPDPTAAPNATLNDIPLNADSIDVLNILQKEQQLELEKRLFGVEDENEKAFIIYDVANNFQQKLSKMRQTRRNRLRLVIEQCKTALSQIKRLSTSLNILNFISLMRAIAVGDANLRLYRINQLTNMHQLMLFFTARDQEHMTVISHALVDYVRTHPQFYKAQPKSDAHSDLKKAVENIGNTTEENTEKLVDGKKHGELLVFSRNDLQWRMLDLGNVLVHLSYGHERKLTDMESLLKPFEIDIPASTAALTKIQITKCIELTPVGQVDADSTYKLDKDTKDMGDDERDMINHNNESQSSSIIIGSDKTLFPIESAISRNLNM